jgi:circadian clock protein KaiB
MSHRSIYEFCLYVAGDTTNSVQAIANLGALCREYLPGRHHIELVDVLSHPERALAAGVLMTPTLIKRSPGPALRVVGTLGQLGPLLLAIRLPAMP